MPLSSATRTIGRSADGTARMRSSRSVSFRYRTRPGGSLKSFASRMRRTSSRSDKAPARPEPENVLGGGACAPSRRGPSPRRRASPATTSVRGSAFAARHARASGGPRLANLPGRGRSRDGVGAPRRTSSRHGIPADAAIDVAIGVLDRHAENVPGVIGHGADREDFDVRLSRAAKEGAHLPTPRPPSEGPFPARSRSSGPTRSRASCTPTTPEQAVGQVRARAEVPPDGLAGPVSLGLRGRQPMRRARCIGAAQSRAPDRGARADGGMRRHRYAAESRRRSPCVLAATSSSSTGIPRAKVPPTAQATINNQRDVPTPRRTKAPGTWGSEGDRRVGHEGLEPSANGLRVHCSTN